MIHFLQSLDPKLVYAMISAIAGLLIYAWRKISIASWDLVTRKNEILQTLPAMILSGLMSAAPAIGTPTWNLVGNIVFGAFFSGGASIVGHQILKASPLPYNGGQPLAPPLFPPEEPRAPVVDPPKAGTDAVTTLNERPKS